MLNPNLRFGVGWARLCATRGGALALVEPQRPWSVAVEAVPAGSGWTGSPSQGFPKILVVAEDTMGGKSLREGLLSPELGDGVAEGTRPLSSRFSA